MSFRYCEYAPHPSLAGYIECLWDLHVLEDLSSHPVTPDGCIDIIYRRGPSDSSLVLAGSMSRTHRFDLQAREHLTGIRFQSGAAASFFRADFQQFTDRQADLSEIAGRRAVDWKTRLDDVATDSGRRERCASLLPHPEPPDPVQPALRLLERRTVIEVAAQCGLSSRQLQRRTLELCGLTPKQLGRILRFRRASTLAPQLRPSELAMECGYSDQSHLAREFRAFTGCAMSDFFKTERRGPATL